MTQAAPDLNGNCPQNQNNNPGINILYRDYFTSAKKILRCSASGFQIFIADP